MHLHLCIPLCRQLNLILFWRTRIGCTMAQSITLLPLIARAGFDWGLIPVGFVVDKKALGESFCPENLSIPLLVLLHRWSIIIFHSSTTDAVQTQSLTVSLNNAPLTHALNGCSLGGSVPLVQRKRAPWLPYDLTFFLNLGIRWRRVVILVIHLPSCL